MRIDTAMVFAAGEGRRMLPLTATRPKPLLEVGGKSLLEHTLIKLDHAGIKKAVINAAYLAEQIEVALGNFRFSQLSCELSIEEKPLETGAGLQKALPLLGDRAFLLINSDIYTEFDLAGLCQVGMRASKLAHLVLVNNPSHKGVGDFALDKDGELGLLSETTDEGLTFSGISLIHPELVHRYSKNEAQFPLRDVLYPAIQDRVVSGEHYRGAWIDVGTPERLTAADAMLRAGGS